MAATPHELLFQARSRRRSDLSDAPRRLVHHAGSFGATLSPDKRYLAFYSVDASTLRDVQAVLLHKPEEIQAVVKSPANEANPAISPDGAWLAYQSDQSGQWEVYITRFPSGDGRTQVSVNGGRHPRWNPGGGELFFAVGDEILATPVSLGPTVSVGTPVVAVRGSTVETELSPPGNLERIWDVNAAGTRFVVVRGSGKGTSSVVVVENFSTGSRR